MFRAALFTDTKGEKQPKGPPTDEWEKQIWSIHTMEYYAAIKRDKGLTRATTSGPQKPYAKCKKPDMESLII